MPQNQVTKTVAFRFNIFHITLTIQYVEVPFVLTRSYISDVRSFDERKVYMRVQLQVSQ